MAGFCDSSRKKRRIGRLREAEPPTTVQHRSEFAQASPALQMRHSAESNDVAMKRRNWRRFKVETLQEYAETRETCSSSGNVAKPEAKTTQPLRGPRATSRPCVYAASGWTWSGSEAGKLRALRCRSLRRGVSAGGLCKLNGASTRFFHTLVGDSGRLFCKPARDTTIHSQQITVCLGLCFCQSVSTLHFKDQH